jgi:diacylglycerol kinase
MNTFVTVGSIVGDTLIFLMIYMLIALFIARIINTAVENRNERTRVAHVDRRNSNEH